MPDSTMTPEERMAPFITYAALAAGQEPVRPEQCLESLMSTKVRRIWATLQEGSIGRWIQYQWDNPDAGNKVQGDIAQAAISLERTVDRWSREDDQQSEIWRIFMPSDFNAYDTYECRFRTSASVACEARAFAMASTPIGYDSFDNPVWRCWVHLPLQDFKSNPGNRTRRLAVSIDEVSRFDDWARSPSGLDDGSINAPLQPPYVDDEVHKRNQARMTDRIEYRDTKIEDLRAQLFAARTTMSTMRPAKRKYTKRSEFWQNKSYASANTNQPHSFR
jgi:hypothetical protein